MPTPTATPRPKGMIIECLFFDGAVIGSEADEFVQLLNNTGAAVDLQGWRVQDISEGKPEFTFTVSFILEPGRRIRIYTNQQHPEWGGFSFAEDSPVWNNQRPDVAGLFNPAGHLISARTYPPGCE